MDDIASLSWCIYDCRIWSEVIWGFVRYIIWLAELINFLWAGLVVSVVDAQPGDTIIDCCAAPGGKALNLASRLNGHGMKPKSQSTVFSELRTSLDNRKNGEDGAVYLQEGRFMIKVGLCRQGCSSWCERGKTSHTHRGCPAAGCWRCCHIMPLRPSWLCSAFQSKEYRRIIC